MKTKEINFQPTITSITQVVGHRWNPDTLICEDQGRTWHHLKLRTSFPKVQMQKSIIDEVAGGGLHNCVVHPVKIKDCLQF